MRKRITAEFVLLAALAFMAARPVLFPLFVQAQRWVNPVSFPTYTVATLPTTVSQGATAYVTDGSTINDCTVGSGLTLVLCVYTGSVWAASMGGVMTGPGSSTANDVAAFNGTGGLNLLDSGLPYTNIYQTLAVAGQGFCALPWGSECGNMPGNMTTVTPVLTGSGVIWVNQYVQTQTMVVGHMGGYVGTVSSGNHFGVAIYCGETNTQIGCSGGAGSGPVGYATGLTTTSQPVINAPNASFTLYAGHVYYAAYSGDNTTFTIEGFSVGSASCKMVNSQVVRWGSATNTVTWSSGTATWPATLGTLTGISCVGTPTAFMVWIEP